MQLAALKSRVFDGETNHAIMTITMSSARPNNEKFNDIYENYRISPVHVDSTLFPSRNLFDHTMNARSIRTRAWSMSLNAATVRASSASYPDA